ncbi:MAG: type II toxin-antitoxin system HicA family toxin [Terriglobales bacterium]
MAFPQHVWNQLKSITADELIAALKRDDYQQDPASSDATIAYIKAGNPSQRIVIHYHPRKTYGPKLLKALLADIACGQWMERRRHASCQTD